MYTVCHGLCGSSLVLDPPGPQKRPCFRRESQAQIFIALMCTIFGRSVFLIYTVCIWPAASGHCLGACALANARTTTRTRHPLLCWPQTLQRLPGVTCQQHCNIATKHFVHCNKTLWDIDAWTLQRYSWGPLQDLLTWHQLWTWGLPTGGLSEASKAGIVNKTKGCQCNQSIQGAQTNNQIVTLINLHALVSLPWSYNEGK